MKPGVHQFEDKLLEFAYGELQPHEAEAVDAHVRGCTKCAQSLSEITSVRQVMQTLPVEPAPMAGLESLMAYAEQHARNNAKPKVLVPLWRRLLIPLSTAMALTTVGVVAMQASQKFDAPDAASVAFKQAPQEAPPQPVAVAQAPAPAPASAPTEVPAVAAPLNDLSKSGDSLAYADKAAPMQAAIKRKEEKELKTNSPVKLRADYSNVGSGGRVLERDGKKDVFADAPSKIIADDLSSAYGVREGAPAGSAGPSTGKAAPGRGATGGATPFDAEERQQLPAAQAAAEPSESPPPPAPEVKKPSLGYATKGSVGTAAPASKAASNGSIGLLGTAGEDERQQQVARSRVTTVFEGQLANARAASNRGDRQAEIKQCLEILNAGAQGVQRAESLKRLCDAYDAIGEPDRAQTFCNALAQEFGETGAAQQTLNRRSTQTVLVPPKASPKKKAMKPAAHEVDEPATPSKAANTK